MEVIEKKQLKRVCHYCEIVVTQKTLAERKFFENIEKEKGLKETKKQDKTKSILDQINHEQKYIKT